MRDTQLSVAALCLVAAGLSISACPATAAAQPTRLSVSVVNERGDVLPCRAWIETGGRRLFEPIGPAECTPYARDRSFSCDGQFEIEIPPGRALIHVERGKEYRPVDRPIDVAAGGEPIRLTITLARWIDMPSEGWYGCDMHVHLGFDNPRVLRQLSLADDVHVTPVFTYWLRGTESAWSSSWPAAAASAERIDRLHLITRDNIEIERINRSAVPGGSVGASFLFNLKRPVTAQRFGEHFPTDARLCLAARGSSPNVVIDTDKPSWAETVVGAALGAYDTVQVCHNHYHRERTIPGGWGMIGPLADGESNASDGDGLFHRTNQLYYRFLNCGFRLGVSAGSAIGVMAVPMGYNRVYALIDGPLDAESYWGALKAGGSFATSGPMLNMTVDGQPLGTTIQRTGGEDSPLKIEARLRSINEIESLQLVRDGQVIHARELKGQSPDPMLDVTVQWRVELRRSGWFTARALFRAPDGRLRQAHTSPVYVLVEGKPIARKRDARYMIRWLDRLVEVARLPDRFPGNEDRREVLVAIDQARQVYDGVVANAERIWGD